MQKRNHEVNILTTRKTVNSILSVVSLPGTLFIPEKILKLGNDFTDRLITYSLKNVLCNNPPDVLHVQDKFILPATVPIAKKLNIPIVATMRDNVRLYPSETEDLPYGIIWWMRRRLNTIIESYKKVDAIISVSDFIRRELVKVGVPIDKVTTIYNLPPSWKTEKPRRASTKIILFAPGRICKHKGFEVLARAFSSVNKKHSNLELLVAGNGPYLGEFRSLISRLELNNKVRIVGVIPYEEISKCYYDSDIVLTLSNYPEPLGRIMLEAMVVGKPIIATNTGGTPEGVQHLINGILIPPNNSKKTIDAIIKLVKSKELREKLGIAGRKIIDEKFNPKTLVDKTINVYNQVLAQHCR